MTTARECWRFVLTLLGACLTPVLATLLANVVTGYKYPRFGYLNLCPDFKRMYISGSTSPPSEGVWLLFLFSLISIPVSLWVMRRFERYRIPSVLGMVIVSVVLAIIFVVPVILRESMIER